MFRIDTDKLILRNFDRDDTEAVFQYRSMQETAAYQLWGPFTREITIDFIKQCMDINEPGYDLCFGGAIVLRDTNQLIGDFAIKIHDEHISQGEFGINISPDYKQKGIAFEACQAIIKHLFEELGLHRVFATVDVENKAAISLVEKLGMRREAFLQENLWFKGRWGSEYIYALLND